LNLRRNVVGTEIQHNAGTEIAAPHHGRRERRDLVTRARDCDFRRDVDGHEGIASRPLPHVGEVRCRSIRLRSSAGSAALQQGSALEMRVHFLLE